MARRPPLQAPGHHPALRTASPDALRQIAERVAPVALAAEQALPVLPAFAPLVPGGGLRRGTTVSVTGAGGATSLALALAAGPSAAGSWSVAVGFPDLGLAAAAELGLALDRLAVVGPPDPATWSTVVAALVEAFDVVLVRPPRHVRAGDARRLAARTRERGAIVVQVGSTALPSDLRFTVADTEWQGLGTGHGHLTARRVRVTVDGRREAARPRQADLWLLDPDGRVTLAAVVAPVATDGPIASPASNASPDEAVA
jgi:hypothetical protein